jgi:tetratricopeptide (TPR) repeat protein
MKRSALVLLILLLPLAAIAQAPSVDDLLAKSLAAQQKGDYQGALQLLNQAVQTYPDSLPARMRRLAFLEQIQGRGGNEEANRWIEGALVEDLKALARLAPDGREGGIARDALAKIEGRELFPAPKVSCPDEAAVAMTEAERLLNARKIRESLPFYRKAVEVCPDEPVFWTMRRPAPCSRRGSPRLPGMPRATVSSPTLWPSPRTGRAATTKRCWPC